MLGKPYANFMLYQANANFGVLHGLEGILQIGDIISSVCSAE